MHSGLLHTEELCIRIGNKNIRFWRAFYVSALFLKRSYCLQLTAKSFAVDLLLRSFKSAAPGNSIGLDRQVASITRYSAAKSIA